MKMTEMQVGTNIDSEKQFAEISLMILEKNKVYI